MRGDGGGFLRAVIVDLLATVLLAVVTGAVLVALATVGGQP